MKKVTKFKQKAAISLFSLATMFSLSGCDLLPSNNGSFNEYAVVQGFVLNVDNEGISNVTMVLKDVNQYEIGRSITDETGLFQFSDVDIGQYELTMILPDTKYLGPNSAIVFLVDGTSSTCKIGNIKLDYAPSYGELH